MEKHACEARLPHINGNVARKSDISGHKGAVPLELNTTTRYLPTKGGRHPSAHDVYTTTPYYCRRKDSISARRVHYYSILLQEKGLHQCETCTLLLHTITGGRNPSVRDLYAPPTGGRTPSVRDVYAPPPYYYRRKDSISARRTRSSSILLQEEGIHQCETCTLLLHTITGWLPSYALYYIFENKMAK